MTQVAREEEIVSSITSFNKTYYQKCELLPELLSLQNDLVNLTFKDNNPMNGKLRIWDVESFLDQMNVKKGHVADATISRFKDESKSVCNLIRSEMSGNAGENITFERLKKITSTNRIIKNLELNSNHGRTELDFVVLTKKGIYVIEVKNTKRHIIIDENGNYYRTGRYLKFDSNIGMKMLEREELLKSILAEHGYVNNKITSVVVFTNNRIEVENKDKELRTIYAGPLPYIIDDEKGMDIYSDYDIQQIESAFESERCKESYPLGIDVQQYKKDFATIMVQLDSAPENLRRNTEKKSRLSLNYVFEKIISTFKSGYITSSAALLITTLINLMTYHK